MASWGEKTIESYLQKMNLKYTKEQTFPWLNPQRCDFCCEEYHTIIEVDGQQHYKETKFFKRTLAEQQRADRRKDDLCTDHFYQVIRIPYNKIKILTPEVLYYMVTHPKYGQVRNLKNLISVEQ